MFKELSINSRMLLHSLLPCCLLAIVLAVYFLGQPFDDRQLQLQQQALRLAAAANARGELADRLLGETRLKQSASHITAEREQLDAAITRLLQVAGRCA